LIEPITVAIDARADYDTSIVGHQTIGPTLMEDDMAKSILAGLTFATVEKPKWARDADPVQNRRDKLVSQLECQKSLLADSNFQRVIKKRNGEVTKKVKPAWTLLRLLRHPG